MRVSHTAVIERNVRCSAVLDTEPYEAGWAVEARWFIKVFDINGTWSARTNISPDGQEWCAHGETIHMTAPGLYTLGVANFGHWLRLHADADDTAARMHLQVYLVLKE